MLIQEHKSLDDCSTMACPCVAEHYVAPSDIDELRNALRWAKDNHKTIHILGGGSNLILPSFIPGLVIRPKISGIELVSESEGSAEVRFGAGENWHQGVVHCVNQGLSGIENLALIPGTCGAAPIQNIGAYGVEICDVFCSLSALNLSTLGIEYFSKEMCRFSYRESVFKQEFKNAYIITDITLRLNKAFTPHISYPALSKALSQHKAISALDVMRCVIAIRQSKLPNPDLLPNSGSFFKNPIVKTSLYESLLEKFSEIPHFQHEHGYVKIPAAWLIERAGWKGKDIDGVQVHKEHSLVLTNPNNCSADKILGAAATIRSSVRELFGINLEIEPQTLR